MARPWLAELAWIGITLVVPAVLVLAAPSPDASRAPPRLAQTPPSAAVPSPAAPVPSALRREAR